MLRTIVNPYRPVFFNDNSGVLPVRLVKMNNDGSFIYQRLVFYSTLDSGASWKLAPGGLNAAQYIQVQIVSPRDIFVLCGSSLCASQDGAQTWSTVNPDVAFAEGFSGMDFVSPTTGFVITSDASGAHGLYKTTDGGATWNALGR